MIGDAPALAHTGIPARRHEIPIRLCRPGTEEELLPTLVYLHPEAWVAGELDASGGRVQALADDARCLVVAVACGLAPECEVPAAIDDVNRIVEWLSGHAEALGGDSERLALFGDSSGGNLAVAASLKASDVYGASISCQVLVCPVIDFELFGTSMHANAEGYLSERMDLQWCREHHLVSDGDGLNPCASRARVTSLAGLPATLVITAELDPLRDHAEGFGRRLASDGVPSRVSRYPGVVHSFDDEQPGQSAEALNEAVSFLGACWTDEAIEKDANGN